TNDQWWTARHDERNTGNYATDSRPPGSPESLAATRAGNGSVTVSWKQPGDDWSCGSPTRYQVIAASKGPIRHPSDGTVIADSAASGAAGDSIARTFTKAKAGSAKYVAVLYRDDAGNWGLLRSAAVSR